MHLALALAPLLLQQVHVPTQDLRLQALADDEALAPLTQVWAERMDAFDVPGAAVAVVRGGEVFVHAIGTRDGDPGHGVDADTMFYIASITKTFNAMATCALVEDGLLDLDDPVKELLPRFDLPDEHDEIEETATVRDLLSHRWGIASDPIVLLDAYTGEITDDRYWHWLARGRVAGTPVYTNVNFTLAGKVVEETTGRDWRDWLGERVLAPAGMTRTTGYASRLYGDPNCAIPMERIGDGYAPTAQRKTDRTMHAAGGLGISAADGARWVLLNLNGGRIGEAQVVDPDLVAEMHFRHQEREPESILGLIELTGFCLGWQSGTIEGAPVLAHGGGYVGAFGFVALLPEHDAGLFVLANSGDLASVWGMAVASDCVRVLTGTEYKPERWDRFVAIADRFRAQRAGVGVPGEEPVMAQHLSRPIGLYVGAYRNEWLGTLHVERSAEGLTFRLGDAPRDAVPGDALDAVRLDDEGTARFVVGAGGEIDEIRATLDDLGEVVFRR